MKWVQIELEEVSNYSGKLINFFLAALQNLRDLLLPLRQRIEDPQKFVFVKQRKSCGLTFTLGKKILFYLLFPQPCY